MKKINKVVLVLLSLSLASCGFVNYVEPSSSMEQSIIDELSTQRNEYISKLDELYNESNYEEQERRVFVSSIIEAKAQINECNNLDELKTVFDATATSTLARTVPQPTSD